MYGASFRPRNRPLSKSACSNCLSDFTSFQRVASKLLIQSIEIEAIPYLYQCDSIQMRALNLFWISPKGNNGFFYWRWNVWGSGIRIPGGSTSDPGSFSRHFLGIQDINIVSTYCSMRMNILYEMIRNREEEKSGFYFRKLYQKLKITSRAWHLEDL